MLITLSSSFLSLSLSYFLCSRLSSMSFTLLDILEAPSVEGPPTTNLPIRHTTQTNA